MLAGLLLTSATPSQPAAASPAWALQTRNPLACRSVVDELNFTNYWLGPSFEGLDLTAVLRLCGGSHNEISYIYGDCTPQGGGCSTPLEIQVYPSALRNKEMYASGPPGFPSRLSEDQTIDGVPATNYHGHLEVYYPDSTVVIFGDAAPKDYVASFLVEGPSRLAQLSEHGLAFDSQCLDDARGCTADRSSETLEHLAWVFLWVLPLGAPFVAALLIGRLRLLVVPLLEWLLIFLGLYSGWWGNGVGESWQFAMGFLMLVGVAIVGAGLALRWLTLSIARSRRRRLA
ncbi:MAG: hypothetical protein ACRDH9_05480 [Actinomycetota bacterium]